MFIGRTGSVPMYRLAKREFNFYVDDTHSGGRILDRNFQIIPTAQDGLRPAMCVSGMFIESKREDEFFGGFNLLRKKYANYLGISDLPVIHMRQLWGTHPPYDKGRNPFSGVDLETRFSWCRELIEYLSDSKHKGSVSYVSGNWYIDDLQKDYFKFYQSQMMQNEQEILSNQFGRHIKNFYNIVLNPLPYAIGSIMVNIDLITKNLEANVHFIYDQSEGSKGFDILSSYQIARDAGYLKNISNITASNTRDHIGLQCADVIAYIEQRKKYSQIMKTEDLGLKALIDQINTPFTTSNASSKGRKEFNEAERASLMLHYELAVQVLRKVDHKWVDDNMYSFSELLKRAQTWESFDKKSDGCNLVRDEVHAAFGAK